MKSAQYTFGFLIIFLFGLSACKKEVGDNQHLNPEDQIPNDYMSTKKGSWWMFASADSVVFIRRATGRDTTVDGFTYSYYETTDTATGYVTPEFFGKNNNQYISLFDLDGSKRNFIRMILLRDSTYVGDKWTNTGEIPYLVLKVPILIESEVKQTDAVMQWGTQDFRKVVHVYNKLKAKLPAAAEYTDCGSLNIWYHPGIGILKQQLSLQIGVNLYGREHTDSLLHYHIEQ